MIWFDSWFGLVRVLVVGTLAYAALILCLRISGKRTLSKLNAFDLVVTVSLGSTLATVILSKDVALAEGVTAFALLIGLQWIVAKLSWWSPRVSRLVKAEPRLLMYQGQMLTEALCTERVTSAEVMAALRAAGMAAPQDSTAVVLETDGSLSVISDVQAGALSRER